MSISLFGLSITYRQAEPSVQNGVICYPPHHRYSDNEDESSSDEEELATEVADAAAAILSSDDDSDGDYLSGTDRESSTYSDSATSRDTDLSSVSSGEEEFDRTLYAPVEHLDGTITFAKEGSEEQITVLFTAYPDRFCIDSTEEVYLTREVAARVLDLLREDMEHDGLFCPSPFPNVIPRTL